MIALLARGCAGALRLVAAKRSARKSSARIANSPAASSKPCPELRRGGQAQLLAPSVFVVLVLVLVAALLTGRPVPCSYESLLLLLKVQNPGEDVPSPGGDDDHGDKGRESKVH
eukprot:UN0923